MASTRRKAAKLPAVQTTEAAIVALAEYGTLDAAIERLRLEAEAKIAAARAEFDAAVEPLEEQLKLRFNALKPWWAVASDELTEGKRKSIELGGCLIGHRTTTPKLAYPTPEPHAIAVLHGLGFKACIRVKEELDKPMILRALSLAEGEPWDDADNVDVKAKLADAGFRSVQKDEFFIDRIPPKAAVVEIVPEQVAA